MNRIRKLKTIKCIQNEVRRISGSDISAKLGEWGFIREKIKFWSKSMYRKSHQNEKSRHSANISWNTSNFIVIMRFSFDYFRKIYEIYAKKVTKYGPYSMGMW